MLTCVLNFLFQKVEFLYVYGGFFAFKIFLKLLLDLECVIQGCDEQNRTLVSNVFTRLLLDALGKKYLL